jgi:hypothetical protein
MGLGDRVRRLEGNSPPPLCAEDAPCGYMAQVDRYVLPIGVWERGTPPLPLCAACPEHSKTEGQQRYRALTVVHTYGEDSVPQELMAAIASDNSYRLAED